MKGGLLVKREGLDRLRRLQVEPAARRRPAAERIRSWVSAGLKNTGPDIMSGPQVELRHYWYLKWDYFLNLLVSFPNGFNLTRAGAGGRLVFAYPVFFSGWQDFLRGHPGISWSYYGPVIVH